MDRESLIKNWAHAYEEDTENEIVFRPSTYNFRPSRRGRSAIDLRADNTFTQRGDLIEERRNLAADDRYNYSEGTWNLEKENILFLNVSSRAEPIKLKILFLSEDKMIIQK